MSKEYVALLKEMREVGRGFGKTDMSQVVLSEMNWLLETGKITPEAVSKILEVMTKCARKV